MLPLQGELWQHWVNLFRERQKPTEQSRRTPNETNKLSEEMNKMRHRQCLAYQNEQNIAGSLVSMITASTQPTERQFSLQWLQILTDEKSRKALPEISLKFLTAWNGLQSFTRTTTTVHDPEELTKRQDELDAAEKRLAEAAVGLEHLFRELCQTYEAFTHNHKKVKRLRISAIPRIIDIFVTMPKIVAKQIMGGQPLEILDGDKSCVPLFWVQAIFEHLSSLLGDKRILILSVMGVQSSGKSTLLNAMFGLQFAVNAGRCTRGIFVQLVAADKSCNFDYILVVDTEGLRAPERATHNYDHDNELATFALGLGDITIINLKGENASEMSDVLQTAVHAFIKLKIADKWHNQSQRCIFIHQNVSATTARERLLLSRQRLQDTLNTMAKEAAVLESKHDITTFDEVIQFDAEKHIWMFPDLWEGTPPMATVNASYIERVTDVKHCILHDIAAQKEHYYNINDVYERISELWKGISSMDFVFSFRNTLEVKAYTILEGKLSEELWASERKMNRWYCETGQVRVKHCNTESKLKQVQEDIKLLLSNESEAQHRYVANRMKTFINRHKCKEIMMQWKVNNTMRLKNTRDDILNHILAMLEKDVNIQDIDLKKQDPDHFFLSQLNMKADELAKQNSDLSKDEVQRLFNSVVWPQLARELRLPRPEDQKHIDLFHCFEDIIRQTMHQNMHLANEELCANPRNKRVHMLTHLVQNMDQLEIQDKDISSTQPTGSRVSPNLTLKAQIEVQKYWR
jgi:hypothetical protein